MQIKSLAFEPFSTRACLGMGHRPTQKQEWIGCKTALVAVCYETSRIPLL